MNTDGFTIRSINDNEINKAADLLSAAYYDDIFFKWCVDNDKDRLKIVADYYKVYLNSRGCIAHVAESHKKGIIGVSVWLPHDTDEDMYKEIELVAGANALQFRAVAEKSHKNEPSNGPFYQLVGFGVLKEEQGKGFGQALIKHYLDILDEAGIPTYLEASTPYYGGGVYGKFGYKPFGELMYFSDTAVLYPLYREANQALNAKRSIIGWGKHEWLNLF